MMGDTRPVGRWREARRWGSAAVGGAPRTDGIRPDGGFRGVLLLLGDWLVTGFVMRGLGSDRDGSFSSEGCAESDFLAMIRSRA